MGLFQSIAAQQNPTANAGAAPPAGGLFAQAAAAQQPPTMQQSQGGGIGGFLKSIVSAPATILARPIQAVARVAGASPQQIDDFSNKYSGGLVAPVPQSLGDVKKDVGRGIQTVALGAPGLGTAGAAFGLGSSLEQGNDLTSLQTVFQTALGAVGGKILGLVGKPIFNVAGKVVGEITPQYLKELASKGTQAIQDFAAQHDIIPPSISKPVSAGVNKVVDATKNAIASEYKGSTVDTMLTNAKNKALGVFDGKTQAEILATPETELHKLSPTERNYYYDTQTSAITDKHAQLEAKVKDDLAQKTTALQTQAESLNRQVATASRDEVIALRPQIRQALGVQSQQYRRLVNEELAPHRSTPITSQEAGAFIDTKYSEDPAKAAAIKAKFGIGDGTEPESEATIGQLYDKATSLGQDIGSAVKKGTRVYTADEKLTDDAIHTITDLLKTKGVDLSGARQFWAQYAPIRNQLVTEAKPFLQTTTQTKTFANTLTRVASGKDVNNENFIKEVEGLLKTKIATKTREAVAALNTNEKQAIANQVAAETQKAEIRLAKEKQLQKWSEKQFDIERQAAKRTAIIAALKVIAGIGSVAEVAKYARVLPIP